MDTMVGTSPTGSGTVGLRVGYLAAFQPCDQSGRLMLGIGGVKLASERLVRPGGNVLANAVDQYVVPSLRAF